MNSPNADPEQPAAELAPGAPVPGSRVAPATAAPVTPEAGPIPPEQSREDTDAAWGEYPEPADDRLYRDRPPHWDNF